MHVLSSARPSNQFYPLLNIHILQVLQVLQVRSKCSKGKQGRKWKAASAYIECKQQALIEIGCFALQECCGLQQPWEGCLVGQIIRKMKKHHLRHRRAQRKKSRGEWWTVCGFKSTAVDTLCLPFLPFSDVWNACNVWSDLQYTKCFAILRIFMSSLFDRIWRDPKELWHCLLLSKATPVFHSDPSIKSDMGQHLQLLLIMFFLSGKLKYWEDRSKMPEIFPLFFQIDCFGNSWWVGWRQRLDWIEMNDRQLHKVHRRYYTLSQCHIIHCHIVTLYILSSLSGKYWF